MIIKGGSCGGAGRLAAHLLRTDHNERVEVAELRGTVATDLRGALTDMAALSAGTLCTRPLYHASLNTRTEEALTGAQRLHAVDRLEAALGLTGQPRAVVVHQKLGRDHTHVVWARADPERGRVVSDSHNYRRHEAVARELEQTFEHAPVSGVHVGRQRDGQERSPRPARTCSHDEMQQAARSATRPDQARAEVTALWRSTVTGRDFAAALTDAGWQLCRGDRRDFVLIDAGGDVHSLARRIEGTRAADIRAHMADIDPATLPSVAEARAARRAAAPASAEVVRFPGLSRRSRLAKAEVTRRQDAASGAGEPSGRAVGLYVTVSRQRIDFSRPLFQPSANGNSPRPWTPARIVGLGQFRALTHITTRLFSPSTRPQHVAPVRPVPVTMIDRPAESGGVDQAVDEALRGLLDAIADEVQARTAGLCEAITVEFSGRIRLARTTLPRDHVAAAVAALKQAKREAVRFVRECAAVELRGRQKRVRIMVSYSRFRLNRINHKPTI